MADNKTTPAWDLALLGPLTTAEINKYCDEGFRAGRDGQTGQQCPYERRTAEAVCWLEGWANS